MEETEKFVEGFVYKIIQRVLDIVDAEEFEKDEYELFIEMIKDKLEELPTFNELYE